MADILRIAPIGGSWTTRPTITVTGISDPLPALKTAQAEIPGGTNIDLTTVLTGGVPTYANRAVVLSCAALDMGAWEAADTYLSALHGRELLVGLDGLDWWWRGRVTVGDLKRRGQDEAAIFTLNIDAYPYRLTAPQSLSVSPSPAGVAFQLPARAQGVMPLVPVMAATGQPVTVTRSGVSVVIPAGTTRSVYEALVKPGGAAQTWTATGAAGSGLTVSWEEGKL